MTGPVCSLCVLLIVVGAFSGCRAPHTPSPKVTTTVIPTSTPSNPEDDDDDEPPAKRHDSLALAKRLTAEQDIALYDAGTKAVVYSDSWMQEGTGLGVRVERKLDTTRTPLLELGPDEPTEAEREAAIADLARALDGPAWRVLTQTIWENAESPLRVGELTARFDAPTLGVSTSAGEITTSVGPPSATPHLPQPIAVFAAEDVPVVVVKIWFEAGSAYGQGFNNYSEHRVLHLR